jgi:hypothetical protein
MTGRAVLEQTAAADGHARRPRGGAARDVLWVLGTYVVLGVVGAVAWWLLVDPALFTKQPSGGLGMGEVQLAKRFATDGWYVVIAAVLGVLSGSLLTWWRSRDFLLTASLLLVGSGLAAGLMSLLGRWIGPADPGAVAGSVAVGAKVPTQLALSATAGYLVWPIAVLAGALFVLWSPPPEPAEPTGISAEPAPSEPERH